MSWLVKSRVSILLNFGRVVLAMSCGFYMLRVVWQGVGVGVPAFCLKTDYAKGLQKAVCFLGVCEEISSYNFCFQIHWN